MLSKEEILMYVQQGQAQPDWQVLRPSKSYLTKQVLGYAIAAIIFVGIGVYFMGQDSLVIVPKFSGDLDPGAFQTWRIIDIIVLILAILGFAGAAINYMLELNTAQNQMLVLMPEGFLLKKRSTEQFVAYANVSSLSPRIGSGGEATLNIKFAASTTLHQVKLDGRYGKPKELAPQIVAAQRQYAAKQKASLSQA